MNILVQVTTLIKPDQNTINHKNPLTVNFIKRNADNIRIDCYIEDKIKDICYKYCSKNNLNINNLRFEYGNKPVNLEQAFNQLNDPDESYN